MIFDDYADEMNLRGATLDPAWMCSHGATMYCPTVAPAPVPAQFKVTMDIPSVSPGAQVFPISAPAATSPVAQVPTGFYERNTAPTVSPSATVPVQAEMFMPMPRPMPTAGEMEPESLVDQLQASQQSAPGAGLLITLALAFLMR